jgi:hypothetical protein
MRLQPTSENAALDNLHARHLNRFSVDGRWVCVALVAIYLGVLFFSGPVEILRSRWRHAGVYAAGPSFLDLRLFPAARSEFAAGGNPYMSNPADPKQRPYNYPRLWLSFMRFPPNDAAIVAAGVTLALLALAAVLWYWGRLAVDEGIFAGILLCSPAVMLGAEKGNTDLVILAFVALGLRAITRNAASSRQWLGIAAWLMAAMLKLFPILVFAALPARSLKDWAGKVAVPLVIFLAYVALTASDVSASLRNTGLGWIQAYGARIPVLAAEMALPHFGFPPINATAWTAIATLIAAAVLVISTIQGWRLGRTHRPAANDEPLEVRAGFRAGALIYCVTYLIGASFDYRQCFLLLTLPQLFRWLRMPGPLSVWARATLGAMVFSCGINFVIAGWPGFFINEFAGLFLGCGLAVLLTYTWSRSAPIQDHVHAR